MDLLSTFAVRISNLGSTIQTQSPYSEYFVLAAVTIIFGVLCHLLRKTLLCFIRKQVRGVFYLPWLMLGKLNRYFVKKETVDEVISQIPDICRSFGSVRCCQIPSLQSEHTINQFAQTKAADTPTNHLAKILLLTLSDTNDLPPSTLLKSALAWLLCDILVLLSRSYRHRLALPWQQRMAIMYRPCENICYLMERLAISQSRMQGVLVFPILFPAGSVNLPKSCNCLFLFDLATAYARLNDYIPALIRPRLYALKSKYAYNLEKYKRTAAFRSPYRASSRNLLHEETLIKVDAHSTRPKNVDATRTILSRDEIQAHEDYERNRHRDPDQWILSVTALSGLLHASNLSNYQKSYVIRKQMELRHTNAPKRWKWKSVLNYLASKVENTPNYNSYSTNGHHAGKRCNDNI